MNGALNQESTIDYFLVSSSKLLINFDAHDPHINLSDHLPLITDFIIERSNAVPSNELQSANCTQLRWDRANVTEYYNLTRVNLEPILCELDHIVRCFDNQLDFDVNPDIDRLHDSIVHILNEAFNIFVPKVRKKIC